MFFSPIILYPLQVPLSFRDHRCGVGGAPSLGIQELNESQEPSLFVCRSCGREAQGGEELVPGGVCSIRREICSLGKKRTLPACLCQGVLHLKRRKATESVGPVTSSG